MHKGLAYTSEYTVPDISVNPNPDISEGLRMGLGVEVHRLRKAAGLTQVRLAESIGISQPHLARLEAEQQDSITLDVAFRLADALGVPVDHFRAYFLTPPTPATVGAGAGDAGEPAAPVRVISKRK